MTNRAFWQRVIIISITGANLLMFYYVYSRQPEQPQTPPVKEQPTPVPSEAGGQPDVTPDKQTSPSGTSPIAVIRFDSANLVLTPQAQGDLLNVFNMMSQRPSMKVEIGGHTDNVGDPVVNIKLSVKRALYVKDHLVKLGIPKDRIVVQGYGSTNPIADNGTPEGRALNRRVEIIVKSE